MDTQALYDVRRFGAMGDGKTLDTPALQRAIDACAEEGGGTVVFPAGKYITGSLHLRDRITLWLGAGTVLKGSADDADYDPPEELAFKNDADGETSFFHHSLIWGENVENVNIIGEGVIDGNRKRRGGPKPIALKCCRYVSIKGIRIVNAPNYAISLLAADHVNIDGVTILNAYSDGIDPDSCKNVRIANCHIESWDDAIVPKASLALGKLRATENLSVSNCYLATGCNCFKLGTESGGGFKHIAVTNCVMGVLEGLRPAQSGIALETVDGAELDGVVVSNVTMRDVRCPIFLRLGNRGRDMDTPVPGELKNVVISNVVATGASLPCIIAGIPGHNVMGVTLAGIRVAYRGGGVYRPIDEPVPESLDEYPDPMMFGGLPAYGLYCRHANGLALSNIALSFEDDFWRFTCSDKKEVKWPPDGGIPEPTARGNVAYAVVCDDVSRLDIDGLHASPAKDATAAVHFVNVRRALLRGCVAEEGTKVYLEIAGNNTQHVRLLASDLAAAEKALSLGEEVPAAEVAANHDAVN